MSDLKKLLDSLGFEVRSKDGKEFILNGSPVYRSALEERAASFDRVAAIGARVILRLMDEYEEPKSVEKPTWEPGTVLKSVNDLWIARLDKFVSFAQNGDERWAFTVFDSGATGEQYFTRNWKVHRFPHEFKEGDWFECDFCKKNAQPCGPFKVSSISSIGRIYDDDRLSGLNHDPQKCHHVPAPRKEAVAELARQEMADGHYTCDPVEEPDSETDVFVPMQPKSERPVTMKVQREDPFTGPHWVNIENAQRFGFPKDSLIQCLLDLADEVRQLKEGK